MRTAVTMHPLLMHHNEGGTMRHQRITVAVVAVAVVATVAGVTIASAAGSSTPNQPAAAATVRTATATVQGTTETILVDAKGLPLYIYKRDTPTTSHVTGQLAALWPPLIATAPTVQGASGMLTSVATTNGRQVAYNDHFLYTFVEDSPGRVTGQGVQSFFVATPNMSAAASAPVQSAPTTPSNNYGY
jgi:predicted lipoprotein with Yx(FWY)xxD motif